MNTYELDEESGEIIKSKYGDWVMKEEAEEEIAEKYKEILELQDRLESVSNWVSEIASSIDLIERAARDDNTADVEWAWKHLLAEVESLQNTLKE